MPRAEPDADRRQLEAGIRDASRPLAPSRRPPCQAQRCRVRLALDRRRKTPRSRRRAGGVAVEIDEDIVALQLNLVGAQRYRAGRRLHGAGRDMERAEVQAALDDVAVEKALGEACGGVGAFVVGDVKRAAEIEHGEPAVADFEGLGRVRRNLGLRADPNHRFRHHTFLHAFLAAAIRAASLGAAALCDTRPRRAAGPGGPYSGSLDLLSMSGAKAHLSAR